MTGVQTCALPILGRPLAVGGGRKAFAKVLHWLENREFSGEVDMVSAARKMRCPGAGVTVVISDFLHPDMLEERAENPGYEKLLQYLNYCKQLPVILHTMSMDLKARWCRTSRLPNWKRC